MFRLAAFILSLTIISCSLMAKRDVYQREPVCVEKRRTCKDYETALRLAKKSEGSPHLDLLRKDCEGYTASCARIVNETTW
jgi:hypothetical protein